MEAYKKEILKMEMNKEEVTKELADEALKFIKLSWDKYNKTLLTVPF